MYVVNFLYLFTCRHFFVPFSNLQPTVCDNSSGSVHGVGIPKHLTFPHLKLNYKIIAYPLKMYHFNNTQALVNNFVFKKLFLSFFSLIQFKTWKSNNFWILCQHYWLFTVALLVQNPHQNLLQVRSFLEIDWYSSESTYFRLQF